MGSFQTGKGKTQRIGGEWGDAMGKRRWSNGETNALRVSKGIQKGFQKSSGVVQRIYESGSGKRGIKSQLIFVECGHPQKESKNHGP